MKRLLSLLTATLFSLATASSWAQDPAAKPAPAPEPKADAEGGDVGNAKEEKAAGSDFIRIDEDEKAARLQTAVTRYEKDGVAVDLIGAVHIADKKYYQDLNKSFEQYDALLFEMVGGENLVDGKFPEDGGDANLQTKFLRQMVDGMARFLKLSGQIAEIDYSPKNFVHADLTAKQFENQQEDRGESLFSFALAAAQNAQNQGVPQPDPARILAALLSGNSDGLKLEMMKTLGHGDDQIAALAGNNVIIDDRNAECLKVLKKQVKEHGRKKLGIFYGAAHFPDMEERLVAQGYKMTKQEWMTAWDVPKPEPKKKPEPKPQGDEEELKKKAA